jgi:nitric oxide synthase oxygenase domain/subunit
MATSEATCEEEKQKERRAEEERKHEDKMRRNRERISNKLTETLEQASDRDEHLVQNALYRNFCRCIGRTHWSIVRMLSCLMIASTRVIASKQSTLILLVVKNQSVYLLWEFVLMLHPIPN